MTITVRYSSIDGFAKRRTFKTLKAARAFAVKYVGEHPDFGTSMAPPYAVSFDGIGKVTVTGCTLDELFYGKKPAAASLPFEVWTMIVDEDRGTSRAAKDPRGSFATLRDANQYAEQIDEYCDGVHIVGTTDEAKAELAAQAARYEAQLFMDSEIEANRPF